MNSKVAAAVRTQCHQWVQGPKDSMPRRCRRLALPDDVYCWQHTTASAEPEQNLPPRILTTDQRSEAWEEGRRGRITASCIDKVLAKPNTKTRLGYLEKLVLDLQGIDDFADSAPYFELGRKMEPFALGWYQYEAGVNVETTGFILHPVYNWLGASPDGRVDPRGGVEVKFRRSLRTFHDACTRPLSRAYDYQMQCCMWVCDADWWDYVNYWRSVDGKKEQGHIRRVERDGAKIKEIENAVLPFWRDVVRKYRRQTGEHEIVFPFDRWLAKKGAANA